MGIRPEDIWNEMDRRERLYGIAEKLPKGADREAANESTAINALQDRLRNLG